MKFDTKSYKVALKKYIIWIQFYEMPVKPWLMFSSSKDEAEDIKTSKVKWDFAPETFPKTFSFLYRKSICITDNIVQIRWHYVVRR